MHNNETLLKSIEDASHRTEQIERLVRSLPGIYSVRATTDDDGSLESLHVLVSDRLPRHRITRTIHSTLLLYLDVAIDEDQISIGMAHEPPADDFEGFPKQPPEGARPGADDAIGPSRTNGRIEGPDDEAAEPEAEAGDRGRNRLAEPAGREEETDSRAGALRVVGYQINGGRGSGLRVRVRVVGSDHRHFDGEVPVEQGLDSLDRETFAEAATVAAERALQARPASKRLACRGLMVEAVDEIEVRDQAFMTVSVSGRSHTGRRSAATGFAALDQDAPLAATSAALDAIRRLFDEEEPTVEVRSDGTPNTTVDPFDPWS